MNKPVAYWDGKEQNVLGLAYHQNDYCPIPLYTHPVKEQLSNGHSSDCAIHNEPALRNKPCDCGFEPKFNLSDLKHEDDCRYFDDGEFCTCGSQYSALVEWYRHKEVTHLVKELTDEEIMDELVKVKHTWVATTSVWFEFEKEELKKAIRAILRKAQEK